MKPVLVEASIAVAVKLGVWSVLVYEPVRVVVEGLDRIFIDEPIAVVVEFVGGVFVDLAVAVVVELLVRPVLVEESVVVVVDEFGRVFIDASVAVVVRNYFHRPAAAPGQATADGRELPGMGPVADAPAFDFGGGLQGAEQDEEGCEARGHGRSRGGCALWS